MKPITTKLVLLGLTLLTANIAGAASLGPLRQNLKLAAASQVKVKATENIHLS